MGAMRREPSFAPPPYRKTLWARISNYATLAQMFSRWVKDYGIPEGGEH
jgi:hypothetical protein